MENSQHAYYYSEEVQELLTLSTNKIVASKPRENQMQQGSD